LVAICLQASLFKWSSNFPTVQEGLGVGILCVLQPITALTAAAVPTAIDHLVAATAVASSAGLITAAVAPAAVTVALSGGCDVVVTAAVATAPAPSPPPFDFTPADYADTAALVTLFGVDQTSLPPVPLIVTTAIHPHHHGCHP
jgi:hypothetical protein